MPSGRGKTGWDKQPNHFSHREWDAHGGEDSID